MSQECHERREAKNLGLEQRVFHDLLSAALSVLLLSILPLAAQPAGLCTATVLNRSVALGPGGAVAIPNVPYEPGYFRVRVTCTDGGVTTRGQSDYFLLNPNGPTTIGPISYGTSSPIPVSLSVTSPKTSLATKGETVQLTAVVFFADGHERQREPAQPGHLLDLRQYEHCHGGHERRGDRRGARLNLGR